MGLATMPQKSEHASNFQESIASFIQTVRQVSLRAGRATDDIRIVAVTKGHPADRIHAAVRAGIADIGENRVQEAAAKQASLSDLSARWHLIGSLQTNKVRQAISLFSLIHSVDRIELARAIQSECEKQNKTMDVLIQIESSGESTKHGILPERAGDLSNALKDCSRLNLRGLMAIGPHTEDRARIRDCFRSVRELFGRLRASSPRPELFDTLSMGMSDDFEIAIEEGSTLIRIGTALFGPRPKP